MGRSLRIGALAQRASCPVETIRYYEREGLLPQPMRTAGNYRVYGEPHLERLGFIRNCRSLDMTLDEIRQLLRLRDGPEQNCEAAHAVIDEHIAHVATRIGELQELAQQLKDLRRQCPPARQMRACAILDGLGRGSGKSARRGKSVEHVHGAHQGSRGPERAPGARGLRR